MPNGCCCRATDSDDERATVVRVTRDLTLTEMSLYAGVTRDTVDATLRDFEDRGWIRFGDNCLEIVDGQGLAALPARQ